MSICLKNNLAKFHLNPICNFEALGFLKTVAPIWYEEEQQQQDEYSIWDQFLVQKLWTLG